MSIAFGGGPTAELQGPDIDPFFGAYVLDWIGLCDDLRDSDVRGYMVLRSLVYQTRAVTNRVRALTLAQMGRLIPGPNGKPSSEGKIREMLRRLSFVGLVSTPEGEPITTSSSGKAQGRKLRIKIHDKPVNGYVPRWRNTDEKFEAIRPEAESAALAAAARETARTAAKAAERAPGQDSDHRPAGQNLDQSGWNSNQTGRNSNPDPEADLGEAAADSCPFTSSVLASSPSGVTAVGHGAGGLPRAGVREGAGVERLPALGGSAAEPKRVSSAWKGRGLKRVVVSELTPVVGEADVYAALDALACSASRAERIPTLRRAVRELLGHYADARSGPYALHPRTVSHAVARINAGWHRAGGPVRSSAGYAGADRITRPVGYLAELLTAQACELPNCELGVLIDTRQECTTCHYRRNERIINAQATKMLVKTQQQTKEAHRAEIQRHHGNALAGASGMERAATDATTTARPREAGSVTVELTAQDAGLMGWPAVPAQLHHVHDHAPDDDEERDGPTAEDHEPEEGASWEAAAAPSKAYLEWKRQAAAARDRKSAARLAALTIQ
ncbi:hypothetical protein [Streptomyces sp. NPDC060010]|uniref:hypothetical protein n=1 Tax=Streptomyces sp. NPDC060010 TaxID=3347036 RepID=UPI0036B369A1